MSEKDKRKKKRHRKKTIEKRELLSSDNEDLEIDLEITYKSPEINFENFENGNEFSEIFSFFTKPEELTKVIEKKESESIDKMIIEDEEQNEQENEKNQTLSKKKRKLLERMSVSELKRVVERPDLGKV
jgi:hypothetical protein